MLIFQCELLFRWSWTQETIDRRLQMRVRQTRSGRFPGLSMGHIYLSHPIASYACPIALDVSHGIPIGITFPWTSLAISPLRSTESKRIHHDFVQFEKQHSRHTAVLPSIVLSQVFCEVYLISRAVAKPLWDLTNKYYWNPPQLYWLDRPLE